MIQSNHPNQPRNAATYALLGTTAALWGSAFVMSKVAEHWVPPIVAALLRFGLGAILGFAVLIIFRLRDPSVRFVPAGKWLGTLVIGITGVGVYNLFFFWGLQASVPSDGSMIIPTLSPVFTAVTAMIVFKERFSRRQLLGLGGAVLGGVIFFVGIHSTGGHYNHRMAGDLMFLLSAVCWSFYTLLGRNILGQIDPLLASTWAMVFGSVVLFIAAFPSLGHVHWGSLAPAFWINQVYLSLFPSVLANWFFYLGVQRIGPARAAVFMYFVPVSGLLLSAIILRNFLSIQQGIGAIMMILGVWNINRKS